MKNNDIIKRLRFILSMNDTAIFDVFSLAGCEEKRSYIRCWFLKEEHPEFKSCPDKYLMAFLDGLIVKKRGALKKTTQDNLLNNNLILKKLKIIFKLNSDDIINILSLESYEVSNHELSAFFRRPEHKNYRLCKDQIIRKFLNGLQKKIIFNEKKK